MINPVSSMKSTKGLLYLVSLMLFLLNQSYARANMVIDSLISKGNEYYMQRQYALAQNSYIRVLDLGFESADLYYNLGNAYYKQDNIAYAILNYEKALQLKPGDADTKQNLALANLRIIDRIDIIPDFFLKRWTKAIRGIFTPDQWSVAGLTFFVLSLLFFTWYFVSRRLSFRKAGLTMGTIFLVCSMISLGFMFSRIHHILHRDTAIIIAPAVNARSSPDVQSTNVFVLHEGTKVDITDSVQTWKEIRIANGNKGWVQGVDLEGI
jgi:hypothetical protein